MSQAPKLLPVIPLGFGWLGLRSELLYGMDNRSRVGALPDRLLRSADPVSSQRGWVFWGSVLGASWRLSGVSSSQR